MKTLIAYFSAEGTTEKIVKPVANIRNIDVYKINPEQPYSASDVKWTNPLARCNREWIGKKKVPVAGKIENFEEYDIVFLGFPIWYYCAPLVINTFCEQYDWTGKRIVLFATSGGSPMGKTAEKLKPYIKGGEIIEASMVHKADDFMAIVNKYR